jgi:hypothetical protein
MRLKVENCTEAWSWGEAPMSAAANVATLMQQRSSEENPHVYTLLAAPYKRNLGGNPFI